MTRSGETYYDILSVPQDAPQHLITSHYRRLAKIIHPDVCKDPDAEELFRRLNEAYQTLRDPKKRAEYDTSIKTRTESSYDEYYRGTKRYRDPCTWYPQYQYSSSSTSSRISPGKASQMRKKKQRTLPRVIQVLLFYMTLLMGIIIIAELFMLPMIHGSNASDARKFFEEGSRWADEQEYQKAIESFREATARLPTFSDAWREKGLVEIQKGDELSRLGRSDTAITYYRDAARSLIQIYQPEQKDPFIAKSLGTALLRSGERNQAIQVLDRARELDPSDPTLNSLLHEAGQI
ncbi:MAG TPA: DnaJ domain-containing protein [Methanospirillum sp.]|nr:DnaJ domain-containing protein [Methanospirillum sp.]